jgi:hypothetical protein
VAPPFEKENVLPQSIFESYLLAMMMMTQNEALGFGGMYVLFPLFG